MFSIQHLYNTQQNSIKIYVTWSCTRITDIWRVHTGNHLTVLKDKLKAILQVLIYMALYDKSDLGSKTTMTSGEWTCLISFATAQLICSERGGCEKFKMKIYVFQRDSNPHPASPRQEKSQRLRPLGHEGLMVISSLMSNRIMGYKF